MKIDPINKKVYLDHGDNMGQVVYVLKELYPKGDWELFTIEVGYLYNQPWVYDPNQITWTYTNSICDVVSETYDQWSPLNSSDLLNCPNGTICVDGGCIDTQVSFYLNTS